MPGITELVWAFMLDYTPGWGVMPHTHDYWQIYFAVSGSAPVVVEGEETVLSQDMCLIIPPGTLHEIPPLRSGSFHVIDVKFYVNDAQIDGRLRGLPSCLTIPNSLFRAVLRNIRDEWATPTPYSKEMANLQLEQAIYLYLRYYAQGLMHFPFYQALNEQISRLVGPAKSIADYVNDHYLSPLDLGDLADQLRYSKSYLCTLFKKSSGVTISEYCNFLRIAKAYDMLRYSDQKIADISSACGFSSQHYFCRVFRKICGQTPGDVQDKDKSALHTDLNLHGKFYYRYYDETFS